MTDPKTDANVFEEAMQLLRENGSDWVAPDYAAPEYNSGARFFGTVGRSFF